MRLFARIKCLFLLYLIKSHCLHLIFVIQRKKSQVIESILVYYFITDGWKCERTIQTFKDMLGDCVIDLKAMYEALYGRKFRSLVGYFRLLRLYLRA